MNSQLSAWPIVPLGSLLTDIQPGFASGKHNSSGDGVPHFRPMNVSIDGIIERAVLRYVDPSAGRPDLRLRSGDVLFNNTNSPELVGKTALFQSDDAPAFSNHMTRLRVDTSRLEPGFLALRLHLAWRTGWFAEHCNNHVSQASIGRDVLRHFEIELPPLNVQREIATLARTIDDKKTSSRSHLSEARRAVGRFRHAVLAAACSGRNGGGAKWHRVIMREIVDSLDQGWSPQCENRPSAADGEWGVIKTTSVQSMNFVAAENKALPAHLKPRVSLELVEGDLLITRAGPRSRVGVSCLVQETPERLMICDKVYRVRTREGDVLPSFLEIVLNAPLTMRKLDDMKTGTSESGMNLTQGRFLDMEVAVPDVAEQSAIVRRVRELFVRADLIERRIEAAERHGDRSFQAVLAKVFRGDLITNDS